MDSTVKRTRHLLISALLIAVGLILPMFFHGASAGAVFLPMQIPILIAGFLLPLPWTIGVAVLTPILSFLITGMPPLYPVLPLMIFELITYGAAVCMLSRKLRLNIYFSLLLAMGMGRAVLFAMSSIMSALFASFDSIAYFIGAITIGLPGMLIQIVFIPPIVYAIKKVLGYDQRSKAQILRSQNIAHEFDAMASKWDGMVTHDAQKIYKIIEALGDLSHKEVIDVGCGTGVMIPFLKEIGAEHIFEVDLSKNMLEIAHEKYGDNQITYRCTDFIDVKDKCDVVLFYSVWPHIADKSKAIKHAYALLRKDGQLMIAHSESRDKINDIHEHENLEEMLELENKIARHHFYVTSKTDDAQLFYITAVKK
ncbi:MAG: methyltransferase domain-containing protein [Christensenellaceae bacterium]